MSTSVESPKLFKPIKVGAINLSHRVVFAPLTRLRATKSTHVPVLPMVKDYYAQRARVPGTLLITEATFIDVRAGGYTNVPGIWSDEQISAWKQVTDAVHASGSSIFLQLWALGRTAEPAVLASYSTVEPYPHVSASNKPMASRTGELAPRPLTTDEIKEYMTWYGRAADNAVNRAGFDGVEVHGANGYLIDQFLQDVSNNRTDEYGGSIEGRSRFALEVVDAVVRAVGPERTALRLSPWSDFNDMGMENPIPQFSHLVTALRDSHPTLAYLHVVEPRISGYDDREHGVQESNDSLRKIWGKRPYISAGGYTYETAVKAAERDTELVAFGRYYASNPDLPFRLKNHVKLEPYNRKTFYVPGDQADAYIGYSDYPFAKELEKVQNVQVAA